MDYGGGDGAEPAAGLEQASDHLDDSREHEDGAKGGDAVVADDLKDNHRKAGGGAADLQGRA